MDQEPSKQWQKLENISSPKHIGKRMRKLEKNSLRHAHTFIFKRWENVQEVRRHALAWLLLLGVLIGTVVSQTALTQGLYRSTAPTLGGTYAEGVLGSIETLNPLLATSSAEQATARLVFSGLLRFDANGKLIPDLAEQITRTNNDTTYTAVLKPRLRWHDGAPLTSADVVFTIETIKNAAVQSPAFASWQEVGVSATDERTINFQLPAPFAPFSNLLTQPIIPAHAFEDVTTGEFRNAPASLRPIGSGPFEFRSLQTISTETGRKTVHLTTNEDYFGGRTALSRFQIHAYPDRETLRRGMASGEINAAAGLTTQDVSQLASQSNLQVRDIPLNTVALAIFKTDQGPMADKSVRAALRLATDRQGIIKSLDNRVFPLDLPIPPAMTSGLNDLKQPAFDLKAAGDTLQNAGWILQPDGKRAKDGKPLQIVAASLKTGDYPKVLQNLVEQWNKLGLSIQTLLVEPENAQQSLLEPRAYDVLVYEMEIEGDPDVYAYWHSSRATVRGLNLANYKSNIADDALTSARSRSEPDLRAVKYQAFAKAWLDDIPAVALYQSSLHYVFNRSVGIPKMTVLSDSLGRYSTVMDWTVADGYQNITP